MPRHSHSQPTALAIVSLAILGLCVGCGDAPQLAEEGSSQAARSDAATGNNDASPADSHESLSNEVVAAHAPTETEHSHDEAHDDHDGHAHADPGVQLALDSMGSAEPADNRLVEEDIWISDFEVAKTTAREEKKDILMDFTGSDWCGWCIKLHDQVFQFQQFADFAAENFVLLELDFPNDKSLVTPEVQAQNNELQSRFSIQGFPTILLADSDGRPYAQTGYQPGGAAAYVAHLAELQEHREARDERFSAAERAQGVDRARMIDEALRMIPEALLLPAYEAEFAEVVKLDADNAAGLKAQYEGRLLASRFRTALSSVEQEYESTQDVDASLALLDKVQEEFKDLADGQTSIKFLRFQLLRAGERSAEAAVAIDELIPAISQDKRMVVQLLVTKADLLKGLGQIEEAKAVFKEARQVDPQFQTALDEIERQMFPAEEAPADGVEQPAGDTES